MRRALLLLGLAGLAAMACAWRGRHNNAKRHPLGGFKCPDCGAAGADLDEMGFMGEGYVNPLRTLCDRTHETVTRTSSFEPERQPTRRAH